MRPKRTHLNILSAAPITLTTKSVATHVTAVTRALPIGPRAIPNVPAIAVITDLTSISIPPLAALLRGACLLLLL
jgi:hypothetical protein